MSNKARPNPLRHRLLDGFALCDLAPAADGGPTTSWHQLAVEGKWDGHWMGPFSLDAKQMQQMADFQAAKRIDTVVDYEHASVFGGDSGPVPAAGWIKALQPRTAADGQAQLWGQVEWTPRAAEMIRAREYKYVSPTILFNTRDRKSGKLVGPSLHSVALTNTPFLHELPELRLNSLRSAITALEDEESPMDEAQFRALCKALGIPEASTYDDTMVAVSRACSAAVAHAAVLQALSLQPASTAAEARAAIATLSTRAAAADRLAALEGQLRQRDAKDLLAQACREGRCTAEGTEQYAALYDLALEQPERAAKLVATLPVQVALGASIAPPPAQKDAAPGLTPEELAACASAGLTPEQYVALNKRGDEIAAGRADLARVKE